MNAYIERVAGHPGVPMSVQQRRDRFTGIIKHLIPAEELALKRKHGRAIQAALHQGRAYAAEAAATSEQVEPNYEH